MVRLSKFLFIPLLICLAAISEDCFAAKIKKINTKRRLVTIDKGKAAGFVKREVVCFYQVSGAKVGCGKVKRAKLYKAMIRVSSKLIKKLDKTQTVRLKKSADKQGTLAPKFVLRFSLNPTVLSHITYNQLSYVTPPNATASSLWSKSEGVSSAPLTFVTEGELPKYRLAIGVRGKAYRELEDIADYNAENDEFITTQVSSFAVGGYIDGTAFKTNSATNRQFSLRVGFDYDLSNAVIKGTKETYESDVKETLYNVKSNLTVMSARIGPRLDWTFSSSILGIGMNLLIPFSQTLDTNIESKDNINRGRLQNPDTDLTNTFNHSTASLGIELNISLAIPF